MTHETDDIVGWTFNLATALREDNKDYAMECVEQIRDTLNAIVDYYKLGMLK